jgi:hypothetical protein
LELKQLHKDLAEATKNKNEKLVNSLIDKNWKLTSELLKLQFKLTSILIVIFLLFISVFSFFEPGKSDDIALSLFDDGDEKHCDKNQSDGIFSNCFVIPSDAKRGAWIVDVYLYSENNETISRGSAPIFVEEGKIGDVWLQNFSKNGFLDSLFGKTAYYVFVSTGKQNYSVNEKVPIEASIFPKNFSGKAEAVINRGTFFYLDLPFQIPLLNISRISGSQGVFIFFIFISGFIFSLLSYIYEKSKKGIL